MDKIGLLEHELSKAKESRLHWEFEMGVVNSQFNRTAAQLKLARDTEVAWQAILDEIEMKNKSD